MMTGRERLLSALCHKEPDRVPLDIGGTTTTSINRTAYERLQDYLGLDQEISILSRRSQIVIPREAILQQFEVDTRVINLPQSSITPPAYRDEWGVTQKFSKGSNLYIAYEGPFQNLKRPTITDLKKHPWPDPTVIGNVSEKMMEKARQLRERDYAAVLTLSYPLLGVVHVGQFMRGYDKWLMDLYRNPNFLEALTERITEIWTESVKNALRALGKYVDIIWWGDDLGTQQGPLFSPAMYKKFIKPRHRRMNETIKSATNAKILFHSDGDVYPLIGDFIETGIDALNPIQPTIPNMDPGRIKKDFGRELALWGTVDTQRVLAFGTPEDVTAEVRQRIETLASEGGFIVSAVHNIQAEVPPENILAMVEAVHEYGRY